MLVFYVGNNKSVRYSRWCLNIARTIIRQMLNPHQNININISYNLAADKPPKPLPAKKINKVQKTQHQNHPTTDIEIKLNKKLNQNNQRKSNEPRSLNDTKKTKKKVAQPIRNACAPDIFADRRVKTEGPSTDQELVSTFKRDSKSKSHHRSVQQPVGKSIQPSKKANSQSKGQKITKIGHITSCTVPNWKKIPQEINEQLSFQTVLPKKRRAHSHSTFIKNDKLVSKLLNVSMLASEIGGSQPITSERKVNFSSQSKSLKQYMSSMDMRIISSMQSDVPKNIPKEYLKDVPFFADHRDNSTDVVRNIMKRKEISLEELTRKVRIIQRKWRAVRKRDVINTYKRLFQHIVSKFRKAERLSDISRIRSPEEIDELTHQQYVIDSEDPVSVQRDIETLKNGGNNLENDSFEELQNLKWIEQSDDQHNEFNQTRPVGLNLKKYRQLVDVELQKQPKSQKSMAKSVYKEQVQQWNSINKQITNIMNDKGQLDSQILLDELIKQSKNNQYWIDTQFQNLEKEDKGHHQFKYEVFGNEKKEKEEQGDFGDSYNDADGESYNDCHDELQNDRHENSFNDGHGDADDSEMLLSTIAEKQKEEGNKQKRDDSLEDEEEEQYDKHKYQPVTEQRPKQDIRIDNIEPATLQKNTQEPTIFAQSQESSADKPIDQIWISQQIMEDYVVRNYLDCGLGDFGIDLNEKIMQLPGPFKGQGEEENQNQEYNSSDEAIGIKFQKANLAIIKKTLEDRPDLEPEHRRKIDNGQVHATIEHIVRFLISQFASDISVILKKSSGASVSEKKPVPRIPGISTNYNSIKDYLQRFIAYIAKDEKTLKKVVDTINKDIGPSSLQILTYLRPEPEDGSLPLNFGQEEQSFDDEEGLFVVPAELFQQFQLQLELEYKNQNQKEMGPRMRAYLSFWHRCIFESYNECLDYERPYGIQGKPYEWTTNIKIFRPINNNKIVDHLHKAEIRLLDITSLVGGLIFQKAQSPFSGSDLSEEQKHMMNEERLSRILATELLESEESWINYNDEMAELLVELSRMIQDKLFFQYGTQLKKLQRRRKTVADESSIEESVVFNVDEL